MPGRQGTCATCKLSYREHAMRNRYGLVRPRTAAAAPHPYQGVVA